MSLKNAGLSQHSLVRDLEFVCQLQFDFFPLKSRHFIFVAKSQMDSPLSQWHPKPLLFLPGRSWVSCCCIPTTNFSQFFSSHTQASSCVQSLHCCSFFLNSPPTNISMLYFFTSFMFSLKCHLARQTFNHSPLTLLYISSQYLFIYLLTGLLSVSPFSLHENRALFCSVLCPLCLEQSPSCSSHSNTAA